MCECLHKIGEAMNDHFDSDKVTVLHDYVKNFNRWALAAYEGMHESRFSYSHYFTGFTPGRWQDYPALQPTDMLAFEGFKLTQSGKRKPEELRRCLRAVLGYNIDVYFGFYKAKGMRDLSDAMAADIERNVS